MRSKQRTTRRFRRVVWQLGLSALLISLVWLGARTYIYRDTLSQVHPQETILTIRFPLNPANRDRLAELFGSQSLIAGKSLTLTDISPWVGAEMAIYLKTNGDYVLGIRTQGDKIPHELLDDQGITIQELTNNRYLLTNRLEVLETSTYKRHSLWGGSLMAYIFGNILGKIVFIWDEYEVIGTIINKPNGLLVLLPKWHLTPFSEFADMSNIMAILSNQLLTENSILPVKYVIGQGFTKDQAEQKSSWLTQIPGNNGLTALFLRNKQLTYWLEFSNNNRNLADYSEILRYFAALHQPRLANFELTDTTRAQEILIDASGITLEETAYFGRPAIRTITGPDNQSIALIDSVKDQLILTNDEKNIVARFGNKNTEQNSLPCSGNLAWLNLSHLNSRLSDGTEERESRLLGWLGSKFQNFSINEGWWMGTISLCE